MQKVSLRSEIHFQRFGGCNVFLLLLRIATSLFGMLERTLIPMFATSFLMTRALRRMQMITQAVPFGTRHSRRRATSAGFSLPERLVPFGFPSPKAHLFGELDLESFPLLLDPRLFLGVVFSFHTFHLESVDLSLSIVCNHPMFIFLCP